MADAAAAGLRPPCALARSLARPRPSSSPQSSPHPPPSSRPAVNRVADCNRENEKNGDSESAGITFDGTEHADLT